MRYLLCVSLLLFCLCWTGLPVAGQDGDDDGGAMLDPAMQWQLADSSWKRREYDDAAALFSTFATANPEHANALEAYWRVYTVYAAHRPNAERKKAAYTEATAACERWAQKYAEKDVLRLAQSYWYRALLQDKQGDRPGGIRFLQELFERAPATTLQGDASWTLAEWLFQARRYEAAIPYYTLYRQVVGATDIAALACYREARCHLEGNDITSAIAVYRELLDGKYNWRGRYAYDNALDAAGRLRALGEEELARALALRVLEKGPVNEALQKSARLFLGETVNKRIFLSPELSLRYLSANVNLDARTKLSRTIDMQLVVRMSFVTKDDPVKASLRITPKQKMSMLPGNMTLAEKEAQVCTAEIVAPDAKGNLPGELRYKFSGGALSSDMPPDGLVITRKWEKTGKTWGQSIVRIQTTARWDLAITLPNKQTNANNINPRPFSVSADGRTFYWPYYCYDPKQGVTFKMPVEVGETVQEYYPVVALSRSMTPPYQNGQTNTADPEFDCQWFTISMKAEKEFPCSCYGPAWMSVVMQEVSK